jgi:hypothetical protein
VYKKIVFLLNEGGGGVEGVSFILGYSTYMYLFVLMRMEVKKSF